MKKRILALILVVAMVTSLAMTVAADPGPFAYEDDGTSVTITGYYDEEEIVVIPAEIGGLPVTTIGEAAFDSCDFITSITIPDSVTTIAEGAFFGTGIETITISQYVTSIGFGALAACINLTEINVSEDNANYTSVDGVLFNKAKTIIAQYPIRKTGDTYTVPNGVTVIGEGAFFFCSLTEVVLPEGLLEIDDAAFVLSALLESIEIPDGVTTIGEVAFAGCEELEVAVIPESVTSIGDSAFGECMNLTIIGVTGSYAEEYASENFIEFFDPNAPVDPEDPEDPEDPITPEIKDPVETDDVPHTGI